ncbi:U94 [Human betaherpesvirus 6B]|nr:U94 [Human betaherpesvirus 6B]
MFSIINPSDDFWTKDKYIMLTIKGPVEWEAEIPGISTDFFCKFSNVPVPHFRDMHSPGAPDIKWITACTKMIDVILNYWNNKTAVPTPAKWYAQAENKAGRPSLTLLIALDGIPTATIGKHTTEIRGVLIKDFFDGNAPKIDDWCTYAKTKKNGGGTQVFSLSYIPFALLQIIRPQFQWAWTNINELGDVCDEIHRKHIISHFNKKPNVKLMLFPKDGTDRISLKSKFLGTIEWLSDLGIVTEDAWIRRDVRSYMQLLTLTHGDVLIHRALSISKKRIRATRKAIDFIAHIDTDFEIYENPVYQLFCLQSFDPILAGTILYQWLSHRRGKKNTVSFIGPPGCGKSMLTGAILENIPLHGILHGSLNTKNLRAYGQVLVLWWKDISINFENFNIIKSLLGGQKIIFPINENDHVQIGPCPIIATSCVDIRSMVHSNIHKINLSQRVYNFTFDKVIPRNFPVIQKDDINQFLFWARNRSINCFIDYTVPKIL